MLALKHAVAIFPLFPRRDILDDPPVFDDLPAFDPVEIDIDGRFSFGLALERAASKAKLPMEVTGMAMRALLLGAAAKNAGH